MKIQIDCKKYKWPLIAVSVFLGLALAFGIGLSAKNQLDTAQQVSQKTVEDSEKAKKRALAAKENKARWDALLKEEADRKASFEEATKKLKEQNNSTERGE